MIDFDYIIFELKRLIDLSEGVDDDLTSDLRQVLLEHSPAAGDCAG